MKIGDLILARDNFEIGIVHSSWEISTTTKTAYLTKGLESDLAFVSEEITDVLSDCLGATCNDTS